MKLGDLCRIESKQVMPNFFKNYEFYVGLENIEKESGKLSYQRVNNVNLKSAKFAFTPDCILFGKLRPYLKKVALASVTGICSTDILPLKPNQALINKEYLYFFLRTPSVTSMVTAKSTGANLPRISPALLLDTDVPVPEMSTQEQIVNMLRKSELLREKREQVNEISSRLLQSLFLRMFSDSDGRSSKLTIGELLKRKYLLLHKDGNHGSLYPRAYEFSKSGEGVPFITAKDIDETGQIIESSISRLNYKKANQLKIGWLEKGDVLLAHNATVGRVGLYNGAFKRALIGTSLTAFRPNPEFMTSEYLFSALRSSAFQGQLTLIMKQTTRNQVPITTQRELLLMAPPIEAQQKYSCVFRKLTEIQQKQSLSMDKIGLVFDSMMLKCFKGEEAK
ncbi:MAG: restriction endonuclease subunit S [Methanocella sp.]